MTIVLGQEDFAHARRARAETASEARRQALAGAVRALAEARRDLADHADADRLDTIACLIVGFIDGIEPAFDRLSAARDLSEPLGPGGRRVRRSRWDRSGLAMGVGEAFQGLLDAPGLAVLVAAIRVETSA